MNAPILSGKHSLSNTKAWSSCPQAKGMISQLPNHHGRSSPLPQIRPLLEAKLYPYSRLREKTYIAIVTRSCSAGVAPKQNPANEEPIAGVYLDVRTFDIVGFLARNGPAFSRFSSAPSRWKKRCRMRWKKSIAENESAMRVFLYFGAGFVDETVPRLCAILASMKSTLFNTVNSPKYTRNAARIAATL